MRRACGLHIVPALCPLRLPAAIQAKPGSSAAPAQQCSSAPLPPAASLSSGLLPAAAPCRELPSNSFTGVIPTSWLQLASLEKVVLQPGNPGLCAQAPPGASFSLCGANPLCQPGSLNTSACAVVAPSSSSGSSGDDGGSSFPVAAVAVPVALVAALMAAGASYWLWRRRRAQQQPQQQPQASDGKAGEFTWLEVSNHAAWHPWCSGASPAPCWPGQWMAAECAWLLPCSCPAAALVPAVLPLPLCCHLAPQHASPAPPSPAPALAARRPGSQQRRQPRHRQQQRHWQGRVRQQRRHGA